MIIVFMLFIKIGLIGGMVIWNFNLMEMFLFVVFFVILGIFIVFIVCFILVKLFNVRIVDVLVIGGLFGVVSGFIMVVVFIMLEELKIFYEVWVGVLYFFMDIFVLVMAIVVVNIYFNKRKCKFVVVSIEELFSK